MPAVSRARLILVSEKVFDPPVDLAGNTYTDALTAATGIDSVHGHIAGSADKTGLNGRARPVG